MKSQLFQKSGSSPYLVFGLPSTSMAEEWKLHTTSHTLATVPSNTAADLLASCLAQVILATNMLGLHAGSRNRETVPDSLETFR